MNIELDEVVVQDVSDDALELAAGGAQGGRNNTGFNILTGCFCSWVFQQQTPLISTDS